ncbi:MAG TPA: hypothetical protein VIB11_15530 [Pedococcus sp.]|jgi:hypothetical protein|uniref:hypothetical protein n=1 Tax=Pedococcus sp. TaxID=2860345 RepID=UPI002F94073A
MTNGMTAPQRPRLRAVPGGAEAPPPPADATRRDYWARVQALREERERLRAG